MWPLASASYEWMHAVEEYMNSKALLFDSLHDPERQRAIINLDDKAAEVMAEAAKDVPMVTYSFSNPEADVTTTSVKFSIWETEITIETPLGVLRIVTPLIGRPNVYNILACVSACISIGISLEVVVQALENAEVSCCACTRLRLKCCMRLHLCSF
jgi:UDP-N-acetylmuramoyl-L-alanyl-D-glutamate--2,6-diaminopimelate ligase